VKISMTVKGISDLKAALARSTNLTRLAMATHVANTALGIQRVAKEKAPVDVGRTRSSIQISVFNGGLTYEVAVNAAAGIFAETGTGRFNTLGATPAYFPPPSALKGWARRHGMAGKEFLIARAIFKRGGLKPRPFFQPAIDQFAPDYEAEAARILRREIGG